MSKVEEYINNIRQQVDLASYLLQNSNLPGPRGNLELAHAAAAEIPANLLLEWAEIKATTAPVNSAMEFLTFVGVLGQGRLFLEGDATALQRLKVAANDSRWRTREAAATAFQIIGKSDMRPLYETLADLAEGTPLEQRCAVAAICEPVLLKDPVAAKFALNILDKITLSFYKNADRKSEGCIALKKGLAYGWSVAAVALPEDGKQLMEKWLLSDDKDIRWIMQENLKKNRLIRLDKKWINQWKK